MRVNAEATPAAYVERLPVSRAIALVVLLFFWLISVWNLDRLPAPHPDELWILSPGYKFVTEGIFGSDQFAGFHRMEQHYVQFMPIYSLMAGGTVYILGFGLFQIRILQVAVALLTVALTYGVAARLGGKRAALWALLLVVLWQWHPFGRSIFFSGIILVDATRFLRYDTAAALFGLVAFACFIQARKTGKLRYDALSGAFVGLAGLAHIYGLFWGVAFVVALLVDKLRGENMRGEKVRFWRSALAMTGAGIAVCLPWAIFVAAHWQDFRDQQMMQPERFDLLNWRFYVGNLLAEPRRYYRGIGDGSAWARAGFWLLLAAIPASLAWLARQAWTKRHSAVGRRASWLLIALVCVMGLFALLLQPKGQSYLPMPTALICIATGWLVARLLQSPARGLRAAVWAAMLIVLLQGLYAVGVMQRQAIARRPAGEFVAELRRLIPPGQIVIGESEHWLAVPEPGYRALAMLLLISNPERNHAAITMNEALEMVSPDYLLLHEPKRGLLTDDSSPQSAEINRQFWEYLETHGAERIAVVMDNAGLPIEVYKLQPSSAAR